MKLVIEKHAYAPELNKLYVMRKGALIRLPVKQSDVSKLVSIKEARKLFARYKAPFLHVVIKKQFAEPYQWLDSVQGGRISSRKELLEYIRADDKKNQYGEYIDREHCEYTESYTMPTPKRTIKIRLIG